MNIENNTEPKQSGNYFAGFGNAISYDSLLSVQSYRIGMLTANPLSNTHQLLIHSLF